MPCHPYSTIWIGNVLLQMCRPQPYMLYNKSIQNRISIYVQQRSNTNVRRKSSNEQNRNARSSSQSDTRRDGKEKFWTTAIKRLRYLVHLGQTLNETFQITRSNGQSKCQKDSAASRQKSTLVRRATPQMDVWRATRLLGGLSLLTLGVHLDSGSITALKVQLL